MATEFNNLLEGDLTSRDVSVGHIVEGTVVQINEDGVFVDIGAKSEGHLELDQILEDELRKLQVGDKLRVKIVKSKDGEFKLSKKSVDIDEAWVKLQDDHANNREVEVTLSEKVKNGYNCTAYGSALGFVHHTNFRGRPALGSTFKAHILDMNRKMRKLVFTRRDLIKAEYEEALDKDYGQLMEGMVVEGVVERLTQYGAFVRITNNVTGLLHVSEMAFERVTKPTDVLKPGDVIPVKVLAIDREKNKVSLSRKQAMKDPLLTMLPGEEMDGKVESITDFGVFVRLESGLTGLVHISELSHRRFENPNEVVKPGEIIRVKILRVQTEDRRISLSAKSCERDPWSEVFSKYVSGQEVKGPITSLLQSGAVMQLDNFFEAFIPISEMSEDRIKHPSDVLAEGQEITAYILTVDGAKRRIRASLRRREETAGGATPQHREVYIENEIKPTGGKVTLGDILAGKLDLSSASKRDKAPEPARAAVAVNEPEPEVVTEVAPEDELAEPMAVEVATEPETAEPEVSAAPEEAATVLAAAAPDESEAVDSDAAGDEPDTTEA
jgi:small subunit ribosomal protein S1